MFLVWVAVWGLLLLDELSSGALLVVFLYEGGTRETEKAPIGRKFEESV